MGSLTFFFFLFFLFFPRHLVALGLFIVCKVCGKGRGLCDVGVRVG